MTEDFNRQPAKPRRGWRYPLRPPVLVFMLVFGAGAYFAYAYFQSNSQLRQFKQAAIQSPDKEAGTLIAKISTHMTLPAEKPTIATVEDTKKLAGQTFFKNAHNGDKVLMYAQNKKAILYRPSEDKVIEVAYLNIKKK